MKGRVAHVSWALCAAVGVAALLAGSTVDAQSYRRIRCESRDGREQFCRASIGGDVRLVRQLSDTPCRRGQNWRSATDGIYVRDGCRAEFEYLEPGSGWGGSGSGWGGGSGGSYDRLRCESENNRDRYCAASIAGNVSVTRQLSDTACIQGRTWSWDRNGIRVWNGCRAEFSYQRRSGSGAGWGSGGSGGGWDNPYSRLTCRSSGNREEYCSASISGDVRVVRQLGGTACVQGRTWNWSHDGIRVWSGCRAEFEYRRGDSWGGSGGGFGGGWGSSGQSRRIACESKDYRERFCPATISGSVRVVKQKSDRPCDLGRTWNWSHDGIRVWDGCSAEFEYLSR